jgi:hypothetical protein
MPEEDQQRAEFRERWRTRPIHDGQVEILGYSSSHGSSAQRVRLLPSGCIAFAKRASNDDRRSDGAHEYVAAELANFLGVSVPPVGFWYNTGGRAFVLSIRAFREMARWDEVDLTAADHEALRPIFSASAVLHTWIAEADHTANPGNLIVDAGSPAGNPRVSFIDHSLSLTAVWTSGHPPASLPEQYYIRPEAILRESVSSTIDKVHGVSERVLESMISRIPESLLPPPKGKTVLECLRRRAGELRAAFATASGGN